jgi:hypothetical protein
MNPFWRLEEPEKDGIIDGVSTPNRNPIIFWSPKYTRRLFIFNPLSVEILIFEFYQVIESGECPNQYWD